MKLARFGDIGHEKPGIIDGGGTLRDLSQAVADIDADVLSPQRLSQLSVLDPTMLPEVAGTPRLGAPVAGIGKIVAIGLNYRDHAAEAGMAEPDEPIIFMKAVSALSGPNDPVMLPRDAEKTDWEVELAVVIGTRASYVEEADALSHVAGYTICNDVSERDYQLHRGGTWDKGKGCDTFAPLGPWVVTADEVPDPQALALQTEVNDERMQDGNTADMIFGVATLVSYASRFMTLHPGDVIITGTPAGVGMGRKPPVYLKPGDVMALGIDYLGEQRQEVIPWAPA
jgi:2-keto-4-pentenoate hydratase/2-oxohepta-3-ene-1,7-dioic acid hydratase in catechol pathway